MRARHAGRRDLFFPSLTLIVAILGPNLLGQGLVLASQSQAQTELPAASQAQAQTEVGPAVQPEEAHSEVSPQTRPAVEAARRSEATTAGAPATPRFALSRRHPDLAAAELEVARLEAGLTPWGQIDYSARLGPVLRYRDYPGDGREGDWTSRFSLSTRIDFAPRPSTRARALQDLERTRRQLLLLELTGIEDALLAHAHLLIAQEQESQALTRLAAGEPNDADSAGNSSGNAGSAPSVDAEPSRATPAHETSLQSRQEQLGPRKARLELSEARQILLRAQEAALAHGLPARVVYEPLRFLLPGRELPHPEAAASHGYRMLELKLIEAEAELAELLRRPLDDLRLRGAYRNRSGSLDMETGMINGRPAMTLGLDLPGGPERWELQLSVQLLVEPSARETLRLEAETERARRELLAFADEFEQAFRHALTEAELSEEALAIAEEGLSLAVELRRQAQETLAGKEQSPVTIAERDRRALERAMRDESSARIRLYRAWIAYVRKVGDLLELGGARWIPATR